MSGVLVIDTATPATVVGLRTAEGALHELRHDPREGERPGHVAQLPALALRACRDAGVALAALDRIGVGVGPGSFTGLRIGIATARSLSHATGVALVPVSTLAALAAAADTGAGRMIAAVVDARRGEAFVAAYRDGERIAGPLAAGPETLTAIVAGLGATPLAVGGGALIFRDALVAGGAAVPDDDSPLHRVAAAGLCEIAAAGEPVAVAKVVPDYVRAPDARPRLTARAGAA